MTTTTFDHSYYINWSLLSPTPCLYRLDDDVIVFWNGKIMTYNMALSLTADILFNTPISYGISDQITEDYKKLLNSKILSADLDPFVGTLSGRELYTHVKVSMHEHISKLIPTLPNRKQALTWFNKAQCINYLEPSKH